MKKTKEKLKKVSRLKKGLWSVSIIVLLVLGIGVYFPTWTPDIEGKNSISVLEEVQINGSNHTIMIRGQHVDNPVIVYVHGGPGASEIPHAKQYQDLLESQFTVVNYDQRGSGKSYHEFEDYSNMSADLLVNDLLKITDYVSMRLDKKKVILIAHSYGTYIGSLAAQKSPEKYEAYIGIGQMGNTQMSEIDSWNYVMKQAQIADKREDIERLNSMHDAIRKGQTFTPRDIVSRYGGASRLMDNPDESFWGKVFSSEYNIMDAIHYNKGMMTSQGVLINEVMEQPLSSRLKQINIPFYFVMGNYDFMTSSHAAKTFFDNIDTVSQKEFITYEQSAHYPQYEEKERFFRWMVATFIH